jgi:hypothetical protein
MGEYCVLPEHNVSHACNTYIPGHPHLYIVNRTTRAFLIDTYTGMCDNAIVGPVVTYKPSYVRLSYYNVTVPFDAPYARVIIGSHARSTTCDIL